MKSRIKETQFLTEGYPFNPITERLEGLKEEKREWVKEFYKSVGYALFLARQEDDTSLRQSYILLDNAVEQFLKSYLQNVKKIKPNQLSDFRTIISISKDKIKRSKNILDRIQGYHDKRNHLYHSTVYLSISKIKFSDYLDDVFSLCKSMHPEEVSGIITKEFNGIMLGILEKEKSRRYETFKKIEDLLKDNFKMSPSAYQGDILLGCVPNESKLSAIYDIKLLLAGIFAMKKTNGKSARVLELIEANEENSDHTFFISEVESHLWYCFYGCFWSKWGEGDYPIKELRKFIAANKEKIDYKTDYIRKGFIDGAFDPYYTGNEYWRKNLME